MNTKKQPYQLAYALGIITVCAFTTLLRLTCWASGTAVTPTSLRLEHACDTSPCSASHTYPPALHIQFAFLAYWPALRFTHPSAPLSFMHCVLLGVCCMQLGHAFDAQNREVPMGVQHKQDSSCADVSEQPSFPCPTSLPHISTPFYLHA